jgi:hypothetical protein
MADGTALQQKQAMDENYFIFLLIDFIGIIERNGILWFFFFLLHAPSELANVLAQPVVASVKVYERVAAVEGPTACGWVEKAVVGFDVHHIGNEHVVRAEGHDFLHAAFDAEGRLFDDGGLNDGRFARGEVHLLKLVVVAAGAHAAPVGGTCQRFGGEVDDKLHGFLYDAVGVAFGTYADIAHGRVAANGAHPSGGHHIVVFGLAAATDQHGRQRIYHGSGFPVLLHCIDGIKCGWQEGEDWRALFLAEFDIFQMHGFLAVAAFENALFAVDDIEMGGHGLVVGDAFRVSSLASLY